MSEKVREDRKWKKENYQRKNTGKFPGQKYFEF